ncbi:MULTISPECIES: FAD-binding oxidoreductase [unclassified Ensifer]|uniref:FAD-binding oxidoreductase n=1 Tax=unclassified Ensifer TaxID=2633371 RepID=UPI000813D06D|nr:MULTISPECIES: FAD-binding oxidoreductase [unclassified Ensifer]OCP21371.1 hydroxyacid dehydrogenase [Ensifer sp. LC384]OCP22405.1 hydroxyacid dehydrogenase [Ensifer sp. LC54]
MKLEAPQTPARALSPEIIERLKQVVGPSGWSTDPDVLEAHTVDWLRQFRGASPLLLKPAMTEEVAAIVSICAEVGVKLVPQGGNTSLMGGSVPFGTGDEIVVNLSRMNKVRAVDPLNDTITVEAGCILASVQAEAEKAGRLFPLRLGAEGSCQIGGNIASNAGGTNVLRYGNTRDLVLGLEVVLPDGRIWNGLRGLRKDNTGYDLKQLFIGSEGTLGIITSAVLKLSPRPASVETAICAVASLDAALELLARCKVRTGGQVTAFELLPRIGIELVLKHFPATRFPLADLYDWQVLVEFSSGEEGSTLRDTMEEVLAGAFEAELVLDAAIGASGEQSKAFWLIREGLAEADVLEGASIHCDVAVPLSVMPDFLRQTTQAVECACVGARVVAFGHMGDGNVHFGIVQPMDASADAFHAREHEISGIVHDLAHRFDGTISAEHGLGRVKREAIRTYRDAVEHDLMVAVKQALDPQNIMNPGKLVDAGAARVEA